MRDGIVAIETLQQLIRQLSGYGQKPAVVAFQKKHVVTWSFGKLAHTARCLGAGLTGAGLRPGDTVGLFAPNVQEWVVACIGAIHEEMVPVLIDAQMGNEDLCHVEAYSEIHLLFTTRLQLHRLKRLGLRRYISPILLYFVYVEDLF